MGVGTPIHPPPGAGAALLTHSQADGAQTSWWELEELLPGFAPPPAVPELGAVQQQVASKKFCNRITRKETGACGGMAMIISDTSRAWREGAARLSHPPAAWACRLLPGLSFASRSSVFGAQCWESVWLCKARLWGQGLTAAGEDGADLSEQVVVASEGKAAVKVLRGTLGIKSVKLTTSLSSWETGRRAVEQGLLECGGRAFGAVCVVAGVCLTLKSLSLGALFRHLIIRSPGSGNHPQSFHFPWLLVYSLWVGTSLLPTPDPLSFRLCPALCPRGLSPHPATPRGPTGPTTSTHLNSP